MKSGIAALILGLSLLSKAQTNAVFTNRVLVTVYVTPANAALLADFQSNGVPVDTVVTLGVKAAMSQAKVRLLDQINHMPLSELSAAYPHFLPLINTDAPISIQEQELRTLASMQLSKVKTAGDADHLSSLIYGAQYSSHTNLIPKTKPTSP